MGGGGEGDEGRGMMGSVDFDSATANMYGCEPCPKCGSKHRAAYTGSKAAKRWGRATIECDDCGHVEPAEFVDEDCD